MLLHQNTRKSPLTFSCWWWFKVFPRMWQHIYAQLKGPTYALVLPAHTASLAPHEYYSCPFAICLLWIFAIAFRPRGWLGQTQLICCAESGNGGTQPRRLTPHSLFTSWLCCDAKCSMEWLQETCTVCTYPLDDSKTFIFFLHILKFTLSMHIYCTLHIYIYISRWIQGRENWRWFGTEKI